MVHEIQLPISKSIANRYLLLSALGGTAPVPLPHDALLPNDVLVMRRLLSQKDTENYNVHDAGTVFRFLTAYLSVQPGTHRLSGTETLNKRPIAPLVNALRSLGASVTYASAEGEAPLIIEGRILTGGSITADASISSQFVSALMLIAPTLAQGLRLYLPGRVSSRTYITLTQKCLLDYGVQVQTDEQCIYIPPQKIQSCNTPVEHDWSSAAFWYALCAITGRSFSLPGLNTGSMQADAQTPHFFDQLGVQTRQTPLGIEISRAHEIEKDLAFDLSGQPDMAPALIVACAALGLKATFTGLHTLAFKESDRTLALQQELKKLNIHFTREAEVWKLDATGVQWQAAELHTYNDHRLAMAFMCFTALHPGISIENPECVAKSYPRFIHHFNTVFLN